jgi:hypothetical protein
MPSAFARPATRVSPATSAAAPACWTIATSVSACFWNWPSSSPYCGRITEATSPPFSAPSSIAARAAQVLALGKDQHQAAAGFGVGHGCCTSFDFGPGFQRPIAAFGARHNRSKRIDGRTNRINRPPCPSTPQSTTPPYPPFILVGMTKGGMGEALALMGVPILAMAVPPVQAAAILLPILVVMDVRLALDLAPPQRPHAAQDAAARRPRRRRDRLGDVGLCAARRAAPHHRPHHRALRRSATSTTATARAAATSSRPKPHRVVLPAAFFGTLVRLWQLRRPCRRRALPGLRPAAEAAPARLYRCRPCASSRSSTSIKLGPYFALGQLDTTNLTISATLVPLAIASDRARRLSSSSA